MRRGEIWTVAVGVDHAGKPRPVVIVQDDAFDTTHSLTICCFTTESAHSPLFRLVVQPDDKNGLVAPSRLMADKITTVPKSKFGRRLGALGATDLARLDRAMLVFLGHATPKRASGSAAPSLD